MAGYVKGDPFWTRVRAMQEGRHCAGCDTVLKRGERVFYWPKGHRIECGKCGAASERRFEAECALESW